MKDERSDVSGDRALDKACLAVWRSASLEQKQEQDLFYLLPVSKKGLEVDGHLLLMVSDVTSLDAGPEVAHPLELISLAALEQNPERHDNQETVC